MWGKDDGDYDSPTSRDETPDEKEKKEAKKSPTKKRKKWEKKREGAMLLSFSTLVLQSSTMFFI